MNAFSGLMYLNGYKDGPPYMIQKFVTDYYAGLFAYGAALAGYVNALRTGEGEDVYKRQACTCSPWTVPA